MLAHKLNGVHYINNVLSELGKIFVIRYIRLQPALTTGKEQGRFCVGAGAASPRFTPQVQNVEKFSADLHPCDLSIASILLAVFSLV